MKNEFVRFASNDLRVRVGRIIRPPTQPGLGIAGTMATGMGDRKVSFTLVNAKVRDILDKLSLAADFKLWIVTYPESRTLTKSGFRRTASLYTNNVVPDEEQPVWALLQWGDALPK